MESARVSFLSVIPELDETEKGEGAGAGALVVARPDAAPLIVPTLKLELHVTPPNLSWRLVLFTTIGCLGISGLVVGVGFLLNAMIHK